jgi:hypothetical protein
MGDKPRMLTAKQFAAETGISYPVIIEWLKEGKIPEAEQTSFKVWQIPATVTEVFKKPENRPKLGRPPKAADASNEAEASAEGIGDQEPTKPRRKASKRSPAKKATKKSAKKAKKGTLF